MKSKQKETSNKMGRLEGLWRADFAMLPRSGFVHLTTIRNSRFLLISELYIQHLSPLAARNWPLFHRIAAHMQIECC